MSWLNQLRLFLLAGALLLAGDNDSSCFVDGVATSKTAVVVGAGPSGLSAALSLARNHGYSVKILEAAERVDVYDPTKAYPFLIRQRGQKLTQRFPDVQQALESQGIATTDKSQLVAIPADPQEIFDPTPKTIPTFAPSGTNYWMRRHEFLRVLLDAVNATESIELVSGVQCQSISPISDSEIRVITCDVADQKKVDSYQASVVIGADGIKSAVRQTLEQSPSVFPEGWTNTRPKGFRIKKWMSPASGLKFKTIHMNANAEVPVGDGSFYKLPFGTPTLFAIRSTFTKPSNCVSLGLLPAQAAPTRTFNIIRVPNHDIWKIRDGNKLREWFQEAFPRFDFSSNTTSSPLIEQEEFDRFASTEGLSLPPCQYCPELFIASPTKEASVIILGDAASAFPPDLGEGVNSGLEDVATLDDMLKQHETIGDAAKAFAKLRKPENKALTKMVRVGAPFQYQQFGGMLTVKKLLWTFNFFGRVLLNKLTFGLTPMPVFSQIADANLKYSTALHRADTLTALLWTVTLGVLVKVLGVAAKLQKPLL